MKKYLAEMIGTFTLSLLVYLSVSNQFPIPTPILAALCVNVFVYTIGGISGTHLNPAVTLGLLAIKKMKLDDAIKYIMFQFFGSILAIGLLNYLQVSLPSAIPSGGLKELLAEAIGTVMLTFGIASVVFGNSPGYVIGGSLLLGISISALIGSAGILNPAVALALNAIYPTYLAGEIIGAIAGFSLYNYLAKPVIISKKKSN